MTFEDYETMPASILKISWYDVIIKLRYGNVFIHRNSQPRFSVWKQ